MDTNCHSRNMAKVYVDGVGNWVRFWSARSVFADPPRVVDVPVVAVVAIISTHLFLPIVQIGQDVMNGPRWAHGFVLATDRAPVEMCMWIMSTMVFGINRIHRMHIPAKCRIFLFPS